MKPSASTKKNAKLEKEYNYFISSCLKLSYQDIFDILQYTIDGDPKPVVTTAGGGGGVAAAPAKDYSKEIVIGLGLLLFVMISLATGLAALGWVLQLLAPPLSPITFALVTGLYIIWVRQSGWHQGVSPQKTRKNS